MDPAPAESRGMPSWVGPLLVAIAAATCAWGLSLVSSIAEKIDKQTIQLAEQKKVLEILCTFMDEKKLIDRQQDERLRQVELQLRTLSNR
jgi:hypothetical protein